MNEEELYQLAMSNIHRYSLLNEILGIRDNRYPNEQVDYCISVNGYISLDSLNRYVSYISELEKLQNNWNELKNFIGKELDRLARECSQIYEDSLGKTRLVNEDIFNEVKNISNKVQELEQGKDDTNKR